MKLLEQFFKICLLIIIFPISIIIAPFLWMFASSLESLPEFEEDFLSHY